MWTKFNQWWTDLKAWFNYAWSIFIARITAIAGLVIAAVSTVDWSLVFSGIQTGMEWTRVTTMGLVIFIHGIISEVGRRAGTKVTNDGQLIPATVTNKSEVLKKIKEVKPPKATG